MVRRFYCGMVFSLLSLCWPLAASAFESFVIENIEVEGLQRIAPGTVFNQLSLSPGDIVDEKTSAQAIDALYRSGQYKDVVLERRGNTLIVFVEERPTIAELEIEGSDSIPKEDLLDSLKQVDFAEGRVFNPLMLDRVETDLRRQYLIQGKYSVRMKSTVKPLSRNRVAIHIAIDEGEVAKIRHINIVGNRIYDDETLLKLFELGPAPAFALFYSGDQYSAERLRADRGRLESHYMDSGYFRFEITSTQVSLTPDKQDVYITVNVHEDEQYRVKGVQINGLFPIPEEELREQIVVAKGDVYSRAEVRKSSQALYARLGAEGYADAIVNIRYDIDDATHELGVIFDIRPGPRTYVQRINISGNVRTNDEVVRRELRQMEGAIFDPARVERSKVRLQRLGFFNGVNIETRAVPGEPGTKEMDVKLAERETFGNLNVGVGYGSSQGLAYSLSINEENFLGTGKRLSLDLSDSETTTNYSVKYTNPYYTVDGISRSLEASYRTVDTSQSTTADYLTDTYAAGVSYTVPISETNSVHYGVRYESTELYFTDYTPQTIRDFCTDNAALDDCLFTHFELSSSWSRDSRNSAFFPSQGGLLSAQASVTLPAGGDATLLYYKLRLRANHFYPLFGDAVLAVKGELGYGDSYGDTTELPPFERYYAGGVATVRGYRNNTLGPKEDNDPVGGNMRLFGNLELIMRPPFDENTESMRIVTFLDGGYVYNTRESSIDLGELRYSAGMALQWLTPIGPMEFSLAKALNPSDDDETEAFQFTLGYF